VFRAGVGDTEGSEGTSPPDLCECRAVEREFTVFKTLNLYLRVYQQFAESLDTPDISQQTETQVVVEGCVTVNKITIRRVLKSMVLYFLLRDRASENVVFGKLCGLGDRHCGALRRCICCSCRY
jgi:hypothetical protein